MQKKMSKALQMYETVINYLLPSADYALYQKAIIAGASNQYAQKISILQSIPQRFPSSPITADANMEIANTYLASENYESAITPLNNLLKNKKRRFPAAAGIFKIGYCILQCKK